MQSFFVTALLLLIVILLVSFALVTKEQLHLFDQIVDDRKKALYSSLLPHIQRLQQLQLQQQQEKQKQQHFDCTNVQCPPGDPEPPVRWRSCSPDDMDLCTHRELSYNVCLNNDPSAFLLEDLLNIITLKPEKLCNVKYPLLVQGLLDYEPQLLPTPCDEDFLYFGFHQIAKVDYQVKDRVRLAKFTEPEMQHIYQYIANLVKAKCPKMAPAPVSASVIKPNQTSLPPSKVLYINRDRDKIGRNIPEQAILPKNSNQLLVDVSIHSLLESLCHIYNSEYQLIVAPYAPELILPIVTQKAPVIILTNDYSGDYYFYESLAQTGSTVAFFKLDSVPFDKKPDNPYHNNFQPSPAQLKELQRLTTSLGRDKAFKAFPFAMRGVSNRNSLIDEVRKSRQSYLAGKKK